MGKKFYKRLRNVSGSKRDPVKIAGGVAVHTSEQITKHLLCDDCERRFKIREDYVYKLTDPAAPCRPILAHLIAPPNIASGTVELIGIDTDMLAYFAISVIWRAEAMNYECSLAPSEEAIRDYLMDRTQLPPTFCVLLCVLDASPNVARPDRMFTLPTRVTSDDFSDYSFVAGGLVFSLLIGEKLPRGIDRACLLHAAPKRYAVRRPSDLGGLMHDVIMAIATAEQK